MRTYALLWLFPLIGTAQTAQTAQIPQNLGLVRGILVERDAPAASGEFSVRASDSQVFRYQFDSRTYVERDDQLIDVARLQPGERVEVVSDTLSGSALRYARTIHVLQMPLPGRPRARRNPPAPAIPTATLSFSGVVFRLNGDRMILHTRDGGDRTILLRPDTRYLEDGGLADAAALKPNMRVFVKAGKNLNDQVEAYQVIWGAIFNAR